MMKKITTKEALERMMAGEVCEASITGFQNPILHKFKITEDNVFRFVEKPIYPSINWERYHCPINTFLGFDWFIDDGV